MKKLKKGISLAVSVMMLSSIFAACANKEEKKGTVAQSTQAAPQKIVEISQLVWDRGTVPADQGNIEENWWTKYTNEKVAKLGVKVKYVPIPRAQEAQKLPTMLAAGEAPDLCFTYDKNLLNLYVKNGALVDYTDLLNKYGNNIKKLQNEKDLDAGKINGKQYTFVHKGNGQSDTTFIRKDWLDKLGLKEPTTVAEFYDVLKAFKEKDPGKVGADKLMPFGIQTAATQSFALWESVMLPGFVKEPPAGERLVTPPAMWAEAKDTIKFMNKLYNEKLMGEFLLDKDGNLFKQKVIRGEIGAFTAFGHWPYNAAYGSVYEKLQQNIPDAKLVSIFPWKDKSNGEATSFFRNSMYYYQFFSPSTTKNADAVVKYLDWMASEEGYKVACLGIEGTDYTMDNGVPKPIDDAKYKARVPWIEPQYMAFAKPYSGEKESEVYLKNVAKDFPEKYRAQYIKETVTADKLKYVTPRINLPTPIADKSLATINKKWEEDMAKMVIAPEKDFDKLFEDAVKNYKASGGDDIAKEAVEVYKQQYNKK